MKKILLRLLFGKKILLISGDAKEIIVNDFDIATSGNAIYFVKQPA